MIIVIIDRDCCQDIKGVFVGVEEIESCFVGICKDTGTSQGCRMNAMEELDVWRIIKVEQVCVKPQIMRSICRIDSCWDGAYCHLVSQVEVCV